MKKVLAIILVVALSALCLTGCGFDEEGEMDEGSVLSSGTTSTTTSTTKSATVNTETAEINVEKVLLGDLSQEDVDDINGRINWLIGYTNGMLDEIKGDTKANKKDIAKYKEEYDKYTKELEEQLAAIDEELSKDAKSIENIFKRLDFQDFSIKNIFKTLSFYGKQIFNLDKNLKQETEDRVAADNALDTQVTGNKTSIEELQQQLNALQEEMKTLNDSLDEEKQTRISNVDYLYKRIEELKSLVGEEPPTEELPAEEPDPE